MISRIHSRGEWKYGIPCPPVVPEVRKRYRDGYMERGEPGSPRLNSQK